MKTHDLARALEQLTNMLRAGPNIPLSDARVARRGDPEALSVQGVAVNLATLASLSRLKKTEWQRVIDYYQLPVPVKKTDSVRDLIGRLLQYLVKDDAARERLAHDAAAGGGGSPELARALRVLLRDVR